MANVLNIKTHGHPYEAIYIGRGSKWGNPFIIGKDGNREQVIRKYKEWILNNYSLLNELSELEDKDLVCWCAPKACHGDILLELITKRKNR